jgi:hypothetical protein
MILAKVKNLAKGMQIILTLIDVLLVIAGPILLSPIKNGYTYLGVVLIYAILTGFARLQWQQK